MFLFDIPAAQAVLPVETGLHSNVVVHDDNGGYSTMGGNPGTGNAGSTPPPPR